MSQPKPTAADSAAARRAAINQRHAETLIGIVGSAAIVRRYAGPKAARGAAVVGTFMGCMVSCHLRTPPREPSYTVVPEADTTDTELSEETKRILRESINRKKKGN